MDLLLVLSRVKLVNWRRISSNSLRASSRLTGPPTSRSPHVPEGRWLASGLLSPSWDPLMGVGTAVEPL